MKKKFLLIIVILFVCTYAVAEVSPFILKEFTFNDETALTKWRKMILNGEVDYALIFDNDGQGHVQAISDDACSALYYKLKYQLKDYPMLRWKWSGKN